MVARLVNAALFDVLGESLKFPLVPANAILPVCVGGFKTENPGLVSKACITAGSIISDFRSLHEFRNNDLTTFSASA